MRQRMTGAHEALDAAEELAAFEITEAGALRELRLQRHVVAGLDAGRLRKHRGVVRLARRRLAYRSVYGIGSGSYVVIRGKCGVVARLPLA